MADYNADAIFGSDEWKRGKYPTGDNTEAMQHLDGCVTNIESDPAKRTSNIRTNLEIDIRNILRDLTKEVQGCGCCAPSGKVVVDAYTDAVNEIIERVNKV